VFFDVFIEEFEVLGFEDLGMGFYFFEFIDEEHGEEPYEFDGVVEEVFGYCGAEYAPGAFFHGDEFEVMG
jgi:hypothetical protein